MLCYLYVQGSRPGRGDLLILGGRLDGLTGSAGGQDCETVREERGVEGDAQAVSLLSGKLRIPTRHR
jgi:hypothetical protein